MNIGIVGLGYVGLPLAVAFSKNNRVIGFDINEFKINAYKSGIDVTGELGEQLNNSKIEFTSNPTLLREADYIIISVPTPIDKEKEPDFEPLKSATKIVGKNLKYDAIVIYESTVYPGATEEICIPLLEEYSNMKCGTGFNVGYSPERINPGDKEHTIDNIVKIVSANNEETLNKVAELYNSIINVGVHKVSSIKVAEASKILENTQRDINIAFMNEISNLFRNLDIDTNEVLQAAKTKWNFINFTPGLVGGHCIGVDPFYLIKKANDVNVDLDLIKTARKVNDKIPNIVVSDVEKRIAEYGLKNEEATVAVIGLTFKENVTDLRNSKSIEIVQLLKEKGINVVTSDAMVNSEQYNTVAINVIKDADIVMFAVAHDQYKEMTSKKIKNMLKKNRNVVYDLKNIFSKEDFEKNGLTKIGL